ncbi:hypothetical protein [Niabella hibiscisoli]|uniref:hypothetical protein n=1 Tax=Niabella hibiscisoli TaxID=1825928 RepID=UPI001F0D8053|nr:hypothetical protein [Niabella hibiscisoli]MCH5716320.1 hypothetical protein [Niabella hibiscisoli]
MSIVLLFVQKMEAGAVNPVPKELQAFVKNIEANTINGTKASLSFKTVSKNLVYVSAVWHLVKPVAQDSVSIRISPAFIPGFHWAPHLTPNNNSIIAQHVFRAPAMLASNTNRLLVIVPDLDLLKKQIRFPGIWI